LCAEKSGFVFLLETLCSVTLKSLSNGCIRDLDKLADTSNTGCQYYNDGVGFAKELSVEEAATRIQAGIKGMLVRRSIRIEMEKDREDQPEKYAEEQAEKHKDAGSDNDDDLFGRSIHSDTGEHADEHAGP